MKLTKEDYMRLPKERLAELLVEMDNRILQVAPSVSPPMMPTTPSGWGCDGMHCTNPQMDCINCPRRGITGGRYYEASPNTTDSMTMPTNLQGTTTIKAE